MAFSSSVNYSWPVGVRGVYRHSKPAANYNSSGLPKVLLSGGRGARWKVIGVHMCVCVWMGGGLIFNGISPYYFSVRIGSVCIRGNIDIIMMKIWWRLKMKIDPFFFLSSDAVAHKPLCSGRRWEIDYSALFPPSALTFVPGSPFLPFYWCHCLETTTVSSDITLLSLHCWILKTYSMSCMSAMDLNYYRISMCLSDCLSNYCGLCCQGFFLWCLKTHIIFGAVARYLSNVRDLTHVAVTCNAANITMPFLKYTINKHAPLLWNIKYGLDRRFIFDWFCSWIFFLFIWPLTRFASSTCFQYFRWIF